MIYPCPHVGRDGLQGLAERIVATESLVFLANQFDHLQQYLESLIPSSKKAFLQQFYSQVCVVILALKILLIVMELVS